MTVCTDKICEGEAEFAYWMGDQFSRVLDAHESMPYDDGDLHPFVCESCLPRYESLHDSGEFVRPVEKLATDGGTTRYRVGGPYPSVSYGPTGDGDEWVLAVTTDEGRVEIVLDEEMMYDLWTEVRNVPWPNAAHHTEERSRLVRQVVHAANGADEEMLRETLAALGVRDD